VSTGALLVTVTVDRPWATSVTSTWALRSTACMALVTREAQPWQVSPSTASVSVEAGPALLPVAFVVAVSAGAQQAQPADARGS